MHTLRVRDAAGSWRWLHVRAKSLIDDPEVGGIVVTGQDVTPQAELAAHVQQAQTMDALGRLAGGVAPDFNDPLTIIVENVHLVLTEVEDEVREMLQEVADAAMRAKAMTQQLLAFSRRQPLQPMILDLAEVVRGMESMIRRLVGERIQVRIEAASQVLIRADHRQIEGLVMNLVVNARDAMPRGGSLIVQVVREEIARPRPLDDGQLPPGPYVRLTVSGTGSGMDQDTRRRIFEPFFTTKSPGEGIGLGLASVLGVLGQSGGFIDVASRMEQGTSFEIYLPLVDEARTDEVAPKAISIWSSPT
jgi:signal transduction histidine kinase